MSPKDPSGTLALIGGGEWRDGCRDFDAELLARTGREVVVLPTAAAFEHPDRVVERATEYFSSPAIILSAELCCRLRRHTSKPALAATSAMPEPMIPEPTIPTRLTATL